MGHSIQPCWSGPYGELHHQRLAGQKDQGVYLSVCMCDNQSHTLRGSEKSDDISICNVPTKVGSRQGHTNAYTLGQSQDVHSGGDLPAGSTAGPLSSRVSTK